MQAPKLAEFCPPVVGGDGGYPSSQVQPISACYGLRPIDEEPARRPESTFDSLAAAGEKLSPAETPILLTPWLASLAKSATGCQVA